MLIARPRVSDSVEEATLALLDYCRREDWRGYDPYDALNSGILRRLPLWRSALFRLAATQVLKRSPLNLRPVLMVPKGENPKACALFCSSLVRLTSLGFLEDDGPLRARLDRLLELRSPGYPQYCWGYDFDWQSRGFFLPKHAPNIICTTFAGNALLDAHEGHGDGRLFEAALSAGEFVAGGLNITYQDGGLCFSYTPLDHGQVHNANLLGAAFLARLSEATGRREWREMAEKAIQFSLRRQNADGSWPYGEGRTQAWIDNFHTGYNLVALRRLAGVIKDRALGDAINRGFAFYVNHFFTPEGIPRYYHDGVWPIDIHSAAQSIVTLCEFRESHDGAMALAERVCEWTLTHMRSQEGYFYYQRTRRYENRIPYMRWSQAWMLFALAVFLSCDSNRQATRRD